jgi:hypothetical protein
MAAMKPKVRDDLLVMELDGEAVIFDHRKPGMHHLNPTATILFGLCDGTGTAKEIAADISAVFRLPTADVERQVRALLREFKQSGLLDGSAAVQEHQHSETLTLVKERPEDPGETEHDERERTREKKPTST